MYKRWRWKLHEHSQSLRPVGLPGRRTIAQNESWSQLFITCWVAPYPTPLTCHVKGWGSKLIIGATVRSCQSSAWHCSSRILKPMSRPDGESWAGKTASLPHHIKCLRILSNGTIWLNYGMWLDRYSLRLQGVEQVTKIRWQRFTELTHSTADDVKWHEAVRMNFFT